MTPLPANRRGLTLINLVVVTLILGILAIPMAKFLTGNLSSLTREGLRVTSQEELRAAFDEIERDFFGLNQVDRAEPGLIRFRLDRDRSPLHDPLGNANFDGLSNDQDPDDDGDVAVLAIPAGERWRYGYDHKDDDDNNDGFYDALCGYSVDAQRNLLRQCVFDVSNTTNVIFGASSDPRRHKVLASNVSKFTLTYYGAKREPEASKIDLGDDGMPGTLDQGEGDGIITAREMDWVRPAQGGKGNRNNRMDGPELDYIYSIRIELAQDRNRDGKTDFHLATEVAPPFLPLKRRF